MCCFAGASSTPVFPPGSAAATPNYVARRVLVAMLAVALVVVVAAASSAAVEALAGLGSRPAAASEAVPASMSGLTGESAPRVHVASAGETLWSIADQYRGDVGRDRYLDALISRNGGTSILAGQAVLLP
jgi:Tfp pilus assembly protein FimV